jgi:hypothetical protein
MTKPASLDIPNTGIQTMPLPLSGTGVDQGSGANAVQSLVAGFELQAVSPALPNCSNAQPTNCVHGTDEKAADLRDIGTTSDAPELAAIGDNNPISDGLLYFAINTQGPWHTAASQNEYDIYMDTNGDGQPDVVLFNTRLGGTNDVFVDELYNLNTNTIDDIELINDRFGDTDTALFDSDTMVMPVWIGALPGISAGHSRITYGIASFGQFMSAPVDTIGLGNVNFFDGSLTTDPLNPGVAVFGDPSSAPGSLILYNDMPGTSLNVRRDGAAYAADHGMGAMIVHFQNTVGNKVQIVDLDHHKLTVTKAGTGTGTVTSSPAGINCGSTCSQSYSNGTVVTLTGTASTGSAFIGWSGAGCSGTGQCQVTMNAAKMVTANFAPAHTLTVTKGGTGSGTVTSSPAGINCGTACSAPFAAGSVVTLTATAAPGSTFVGWSGGSGPCGATCTVNMSSDMTVTATFKKDTTPPKITLVKVKVNHHKRTAKVTFKGTDPGNGSSGLHFKCKLDNGKFKSCRSPKLYKHLKKGKHKVQVKVTDRAGNVSRAVTKKFLV